MIKTLQLRVKDKHATLLTAMSRQVNMVWNFLNETSQKAIRDRRQFLSGFDLQKLCAGYTKCDGVLLRAGTVDQICIEYASRRRQFKCQRLNWRVSDRRSSRYSLGWIPVKAEAIKYRGEQIHYAGFAFSLWDSYGLADYSLRSGSFSQDARGRWYFNVAVDIPASRGSGAQVLGVDLGLKAAATVSDGRTFEGRLYRASEERLAKAQRARKARMTANINAKIKNQRKDGLHKFSAALAKDAAAIFVGDVSSEKLLKTKMAKSAQDASWALLKKMLETKSHRAGIVFGLVDEAWTTQTCSQCGSIEGPKGVAGLGIRRWRCSCGVEHDRDVNSAQNIARIGLDSLVVGAASMTSGEAKSRPDRSSDAARQPSTDAEGGGARSIIAAEPWLKSDEVRDRLEGDR